MCAARLPENINLYILWKVYLKFMGLPTRTALYLDASSRTYRTEDVEDENLLGVLDFGVEQHLNRYESWRYDALSSSNVLVFGVGPLAASNIPGTHRLIFCARSPIWQGFFTSTMGGAGYVFCRLGINFCVIEGKSEIPLIVRISNMGKKLMVEYFEITRDKLFAIYGGYNGKKGVYALQQYVFDKYGGVFSEHNIQFRVLAVGPAALNTTYGAICSTVTRGLKFDEGIDEWAGRGGLGSVMAQAHGVVAVIYGGDSCHEHARLNNMNFINSLFERNFGKRMVQVIMEKCKKYHYHPDFDSGGTFGVNFSTMGTWTLFLNWSSIYWDEEKRKKAYDKLIKEGYLRQFNDEIIKPRKFANCGEPCPVVCKKYSNMHKKDYEPYEANGPNSGIVELRAAEIAVDKVDELGFDAIQIGTIASWIMELIQKGVLKPEDFGIKSRPVFELDALDSKASALNASILISIVEQIAYGRGLGRVFSNGIRKAAKDLEKLFYHPKFKGSFRDMAVYAVYGGKGEIAPCQYWVPAFFIPLPIQGKFLTDYHVKWSKPYELGKSSAVRTIKEMYSDNNGMCRFHRGWGEQIIQDLVNESFGTSIDFFEHHRKLAEKIVMYDERCGLKPEFWDSERVVDVIHTYIKKLAEGDPKNMELREWLEKFNTDKWKAAREYWLDVLKGFYDTIGVMREVHVK